MSLAELQNRVILVTGAGGFIGQRLCARLLELGAVVHGVDLVNAAGQDGRIHWHVLDLSDALQVAGTIKDVKPVIIFHLASHVFGRRDISLVRPTFESNLVSTVNLLLPIAEQGCDRFITIGSLEEPGVPDEIPSSPYAASKVASTQYARMFHGLYGVPVVLARLFMVYGPGQKDRKKLIPYVITSINRNESPGLSGGTRPIDWIYVDDVVNGLLHCAVEPGAVGRRIDIGSGSLCTVREMVEQIAALMNYEGELGFGDIADRPMEQVRRAHVDETLRLLGWKPQTSIEEGLHRTIEWYTAN